MKQQSCIHLTKANKVCRVVVTAAEILLCLILIPILAVNITLMVKNAIDSDVLPDVFGYSPLIVQTDAMQPLFGNNDLVIIQKADAGQVQLGDVIAYSNAGVVEVGRIAERMEAESGLLFQITEDQTATENSLPVAASQVVGVYRFHLNGLGAFALFLQTPLGIVCFIVLPLGLIFAYQEGKTAIQKRRAKKESDLPQEECREPAVHE